MAEEKLEMVSAVNRLSAALGPSLLQVTLTHCYEDRFCQPSYWGNGPIRDIPVGASTSRIAWVEIFQTLRAELDTSLILPGWSFVGETEVKRRHLRRLLSSAMSCPRLAGLLRRLADQMGDATSSRRQFLRKHWLELRPIQELVEIAGERLEDFLGEVILFLQEVGKCLWSLFKRSLSKRASVQPVNSAEISLDAEKEKLWPLLMAFKNH